MLLAAAQWVLGVSAVPHPKRGFLCLHSLPGESHFAALGGEAAGDEPSDIRGHILRLPVPSLC